MMQHVAMFQFFSKEMLVVAVAILVLFGGTRLPQIGRLLGRSLKEFKKGLRDAREEFKEATGDLEDDLDLDREEQDYMPDHSTPAPPAPPAPPATPATPATVSA